MRQLLLRVPDDLHRRLVARAAHGGQSVNALANQILDTVADPGEGDRRARLRARATALGLRRAGTSPTIGDARRRKIVSSTKGIGPVLDRLLADERDRV